MTAPAGPENIKGGIGRAVAIAYAREGADVLIAYLNEHDDAKQTERFVKDAGRKAVLIAGDIQQANHCRGIVKAAMPEPAMRERASRPRGCGHHRTHNSGDHRSDHWHRPL